MSAGCRFEPGESPAFFISHPPAVLMTLGPDGGGEVITAGRKLAPALCPIPDKTCSLLYNCIRRPKVIFVDNQLDVW